jgi:hypothetical protein
MVDGFSPFPALLITFSKPETVQWVRWADLFGDDNHLSWIILASWKYVFRILTSVYTDKNLFLEEISKINGYEKDFLKTASFNKGVLIKWLTS